MKSNDLFLNGLLVRHSGRSSIPVGATSMSTCSIRSRRIQVAAFTRLSTRLCTAARDQSESQVEFAFGGLLAANSLQDDLRRFLADLSRRYGDRRERRVELSRYFVVAKAGNRQLRGY